MADCLDDDDLLGFSKIEKPSPDDARTRTLRTTAFTSAEILDSRRPLLYGSLNLVRKSAAALARVCAGELDCRGVSVAGASIIVLVGAGDNADVALHAGSILARAGAHITAMMMSPSAHDGAIRTLLRSGGQTLEVDPRCNLSMIGNKVRIDGARRRLEIAGDIVGHSDMVVDATADIAASSPSVEDLSRVVIQLVEKARNGDGHGAGAVPVVISVDVPAGVDADTGTVSGDSIASDVTVPIAGITPCLLLPPACHRRGRLVLLDIGMDPSRCHPVVQRMDGWSASRILAVPGPNDMKYSRGVVGLITGSQRYPGAAALSVSAAARSGSGMVRYRGPRRAEDLVLRSTPEVVLGSGHVQAWAVGCGVDPEDHDDESTTAVRVLLEGYDGVTERTSSTPPLCADAGAIALLPAHVVPQTIITPHAGELSALLTRLGHVRSVDDIASDPWSNARLAHSITGATVLLKGSMTIVVGGDRDHPRTIVSGNGPAWLSTAGSGDVLAGIIGSLLAQTYARLDGERARGMTGSMDAGERTGAEGRAKDWGWLVDVVAAAAWIHGFAGRLASGCGISADADPQVIAASKPETASDDVYQRIAADAVRPRPAGHPLVASDIVGRIERVMAFLLETRDAGPKRRVRR
ncbi:bifunctional ADP-dependent NAD(P)H-hydrate dehydratase/NAD(P)H-hydrate epimerase [uncultured Bifidobacterium sp.]|uniref:bifunctional ADP-dependent NAD(P)H-hydrate dehydratase/NAD(P)H-hydrate epimerase n=1 Tax=uncultured Bifidobacterium sp. TaxID=165187 RepID=UPI00263305A2|nr:bifunctional ADP-dependent NAD(P)H-hydrate dehydratase/NAD(P)H-hydrate epimerase [uncultured Bifidobacterium sp.]